MNEPYFIMAYNQVGNLAMPIVTEDELGNEIIKFFKTEEEATQLAMNHQMCLNFGYDIFCMGDQG